MNCSRESTLRTSHHIIVSLCTPQTASTENNFFKSHFGPIIYFILYSLQHANADVEKMILGNKCDMDDRRQVPKEKGEEVSLSFIFVVITGFLSTHCHRYHHKFFIYALLSLLSKGLYLSVVNVCRPCISVR